MALSELQRVLQLFAQIWISQLPELIHIQIHSKSNLFMLLPISVSSCTYTFPFLYSPPALPPPHTHKLKSPCPGEFSLSLEKPAVSAWCPYHWTIKCAHSRQQSEGNSELISFPFLGSGHCTICCLMQTNVTVVRDGEGAIQFPLSQHSQERKSKHIGIWLNLNCVYLDIDSRWKKDMTQFF